jgi:hypothetical protein
MTSQCCSFTVEESLSKVINIMIMDCASHLSLSLEKDCVCTVLAHDATVQITLGQFSNDQLCATLPLSNNVAGEYDYLLLPQSAMYFS